MEYTLRAAEMRDIAAIWRIYNWAVETTTASYDIQPQRLAERRAWLEEHQAAGLPVIVAECAGAAPSVVGWGSLSRFRDKAGYRYTAENSIYVAEETRGLGIGSALLAALVDEGRTIGLHTIVAGIDSEAAVSLRMHEKAGFIRTAYMPEVGRKFDRWLDVVFLQLRL